LLCPIGQQLVFLGLVERLNCLALSVAKLFILSEWPTIGVPRLRFACIVHMCRWGCSKPCWQPRLIRRLLHIGRYYGADCMFGDGPRKSNRTGRELFSRRSLVAGSWRGAGACVGLRMHVWNNLLVEKKIHVRK
jgi:hypothetical protein